MQTYTKDAFITEPREKVGVASVQFYAQTTDGFTDWCDAADAGNDRLCKSSDDVMTMAMKAVVRDLMTDAVNKLAAAGRERRKAFQKNENVVMKYAVVHDPEGVKYALSKGPNSPLIRLYVTANMVDAAEWAGTGVKFEASVVAQAKLDWGREYQDGTKVDATQA